MKTIKQIADEIGVSKQTVYKRVKGKLNEQLLQYVHTVDGTVYIEEQGETLIKCDFSDKGVSIGVHTGVHTNTHLDTLVDTLKNDNEILKNELNVKNKQIEELNNRLSEAMGIINNSQLLHGGTIQQQLNEPPTSHSDKNWFQKIFKLKN